jgi:hypothetical protein
MMTHPASIHALLISGLLLGSWPVVIARCQEQDRSCCPRSVSVAAPCCCDTKVNTTPPSTSTVVVRVVLALAPELTLKSGPETTHPVMLSVLHQVPVRVVASPLVLRL